MPDVTNEPLLEHLKRIPERLSRIENNQDAMRSDIQAIKGHMASVIRPEAAEDMMMAHVAKRRERVDARLELREAE